jgi:hypothetical protein
MALEGWVVTVDAPFTQQKVVHCDPSFHQQGGHPNQFWFRPQP